MDYQSAQASCRVRLGEDWQVRLYDRLLEWLGDWLKPEAVQVIY